MTERSKSFIKYFIGFEFFFALDQICGTAFVAKIDGDRHFWTR